MDQQNTIYENLVFSDAQATPALARVTSKVGSLAKAIGGIRAGLINVASERLGLSGLFKVTEAIANVGQLYERVKRLRAVAGITASTAHQLTDAFELKGVDSVVADNTITRLARLSQRASGASKEAQKLQHSLKGVGVDVKHGVTESLLSMATAVQKGKLGINEMARTFKIPLSQAGQLMAALRDGPTKLRQIMSETAAGADLVDDAALASYERMKASKLELADAWEGLVGTVYKSLLPGVTAVAKVLTEGMKEAEPIVTFIGRTLSQHMGLVVGAAKAYLGYLIAARAVAATTGGSLGGFLKGQMGGVLNFGPRAAAAPMFQAGRQLPGASRAINALNIGSQFAGRGGGITRMAGGMAQILGRWSPALGRLASSTVSIRALGSVVTRFGIAGAAIGVGVKMFGILKNDIGGHRTRIVGMLNDIASKFAGIGRVIRPVVSALSYLFGNVLTIAAHALLYIFEGVLKAVSFTLTILKAVVNVMSELVTSPWWSINHPVKLFTNAWADASKTVKTLVGGDGKAKGKDGKTPPTQTVNQDFRGSTFTIQNNFAEGFDIGRVSVALTESIAAAGQRRVQSGFAPSFAVRGGS